MSIGSHDEIIARLYRQIKDLEEERDAVLFTFNQADAECAKLRSLITLAADALEEDHDVIKDFFSKSSVRDKFLPLIAELRKEAE